MYNPFETLEEKISTLENLLVDIQQKIKTPEPQPQVKFLDREGVAKLLNLSCSTVFNWTKKGLFPSYQLGGKIFYKLHEIEKAMVELKK